MRGGGTGALTAEACALCNVLLARSAPAVLVAEGVATADVLAAVGILGIG